MKTLIVFAHPEPKSFNGGLRDAAVAALAPKGEVRVSDLYAQGFEAECGRGDFAAAKNP
ncbi:MAG: NAD(P)H-dependent oxidoreductase, partial [Alphaproteobacteria bacterium]|nr:NAD(P)H-dependent oxidoreductase [Alphaproteobacteria bacterium]